MNPDNLYTVEDSKDNNYERGEMKANMNNNNYKTLVLKVVEGKYLANSYKINISPFLINDKRPIDEERFIFGKQIETNDYNFPIEENVGTNQFEIRYDKGIS